MDSTVDWVISRSLESRHVLVFAHLLATRDALNERFSEIANSTEATPASCTTTCRGTPNRLRQRMGRVTRICSDFKQVDPRDVRIPVLDVPTDSWLYDTIRKRFHLGDQLIPAELDASYPDLP